jgi:quinol monooxygenase YgiN
MTASLLVVAVGAVAAALGTAGLAARCSRTPSLFLGAWTVALFALTIALAAEALGYLAGFGVITFRASEIAAQAIAPLMISLGLAELIGRSIVVRFLMRLTVSAIGVIALVVMGSDPLSPGVSLTKAWPDPTVTYQLVPVGLIKLLAVFALFTAVIAAVAVLARSGRGDNFAGLVRPGLAGAGAAIMAAAPGVAMLAGSPAGGNGFAFAVVLAAVLIWFAATNAARHGLAGAGSAVAGRVRRPAGDSGRTQPHDRPDDRYGDYDASPEYRASGYRGDPGYDPDRQANAGAAREPDSEIRYPALAALAAEHLEPPGVAGDPYDSGRHHSGGPGSAGYDAGGYDAGGYDGGRFGTDPPDRSPYEAALEPYSQRAGVADGDEPAGADLHPNLFGQITIYTLLEDRIDDFDRLTEEVVEQVRADEPGTLVYIVHAVPTAPMQRILYEVYQDRVAYEDHLAQPYMTRYVAERRSMVLATNAIELGLQQAKVSPLASYDAISDMLSESGIDLTGVTRSARRDRYDRSGQREWPEPGGGHYPDGGHYPGPSRDDDPSRYGGWDAVRDDDGYR